MPLGNGVEVNHGAARTLVQRPRPGHGRPGAFGGISLHPRSDPAVGPAQGGQTQGGRREVQKGARVTIEPV